MTLESLTSLKQQLETYLHTANTWYKILSIPVQKLIKNNINEYKILLVLVEKALEKYKPDEPSSAHPPITTTFIDHKKLHNSY